MSPHPPHDLVRAVRAELATPGRYQLDAHVVTHRSWLEAVLSWLADRYRDFAHALATHVKIGPRGVSLFGDLLVIAIVLVLAVVAAQLLRALQNERLARARVFDLGPARSAHALARAASAAADAGEYARAIRLLFAAGVTLLDLRGAVRDEKSATINDLRRELQGREQPAQDAFAELAWEYTAAAYAELPVDARAWHDARAAYDRLSASVPS